MNRYLITLALSIIVLSQTPALAWNSYGHMSVAYVAYQKLTPQVRDKANALLAKNPDLANSNALYDRRHMGGSHQWRVGS